MFWTLMSVAVIIVLGPRLRRRRPHVPRLPDLERRALPPSQWTGRRQRIRRVTLKQLHKHMRVAQIPVLPKLAQGPCRGGCDPYCNCP